MLQDLSDPILQEKIAVLSLCALQDQPHCNGSLFPDAMQSRRLGFDYAVDALQRLHTHFWLLL